MLTEERHSLILDMLSRQRSASLAELCELLNASESTVRRDLAILDESGLLTKVRGGAMAASESFSSRERNVEEKSNMFVEEKTAIARYAASLIEDGDFVFLDAGTTTEKMIDFIPSKYVTFVTNAFVSARRLAARGFKVLITAGEIKSSTEAIVGSEAVLTLSRYNFTKCFMGVNGISVKGGFSTPDTSEADVKSTAIARGMEIYILADHSKFGTAAAVKFAELNKGRIITDKAPEKIYFSETYVKEVL
ncbi:MAG: DeoR/GlpR family DNA-binding transcription regulator [Oscillospiraceae bacterium]|nr:DeoR/GlpR family DNA-binding transcription regulator [Oscillospiraceae bacterium]